MRRNAALTVLASTLFSLFTGWFALSMARADDSLMLAAFGVYCCIETIPGVALLYGFSSRRTMLRPDFFERALLRTSEILFGLTAAVTAAASLACAYRAIRPEATFWGMIIPLFSAPVAWCLGDLAAAAGREYHSRRLLTAANRAASTFQVSAVLFAISIGFEALYIPALDWLGAAAIAVLSLQRANIFAQRLPSTCKKELPASAANVEAPVLGIKVISN